MLSPYYLNLSGEYGEETKFSSLPELFAYLDRLGIWQTAVTCREFGVTPSNRKLVRDLAEIPQAKERVIPVFQTVPFMYVTEGLMEELKEQLASFPAAGIRLEPKTRGFRLRTAEGMLRRLQYFAPVVFVKWNEIEARPDDLAYLAERFPQLNFVIQQCMWGSLYMAASLMERCANIYLDNSWLHTLHANRVFCETFGADRLLFSLCYKSNYGAALGALCCEELPQETKDRIAWQNAAQLFTEKGYRWLLANRRHLDDTIENRFWKTFREEKPITEIPVVDAHAHIARRTFKWMNPYFDFEPVIADMLKVMDARGIDITIATDNEKPSDDPLRPNEEILELTAGHHDRLKGYFHYRPCFAERYTEEYLDRFFATDYFVGLKSLPQYEQTPIGDETYRPMFEYAEKHSLPILLHTWNSSQPFGTAKACGETARKYPHAKVILGHSGGGDKGRLECHAMADAGLDDNIYYEFCGSFTAQICWTESLQHLDYHKILFGTDTHAHDATWEMARLLTDELTDEQLTAILGGNAVRLYGFSLGK